MPANQLNAGQSLSSGQWLESSNGLFRAVVEAGGNLAIHAFSTNPVACGFTWGAVENPIPGSFLYLDPDGYFQLKAGDGQTRGYWGRFPPVPGTNPYLVMQDEGNLVLYRPGGEVLWATPPETILNSDQQRDLVIPGVLVLQVDVSSSVIGPADKTVTNDTGDRVILRDQANKVILPPGGLTGVATNAGTVAISGVVYDYPDTPGPGNSLDAVGVKTYGPGQNMIKVSKTATGFSLT